MSQLSTNKRPLGLLRGRPRQVMTLLMLLSLTALTSLFWLSNIILSDRYLGQLAERAVVRSALQAGSVSEALFGSSVTASLVARDANIVAALSTIPSTPELTEHLIALREQTGVQSLSVFDVEGAPIARATAVESADILAESIPQALTQNSAVFERLPDRPGFAFAHRVAFAEEVLGSVLVQVNLADVVTGWSAQGDVVLISDPTGQILLSSRANLLGANLDDVASFAPGSASARLVASYLRLEGHSSSTIVFESETFLAIQRPVGFRDWEMTYLAATGSVEDRVNSVLALEVTVFAILAAMIFFVTARRASRESVRMRSESERLRDLNTRLTREIEERARVESSLAQAERSLEQSSKLAALGEMSAAIAHELNQPLAAMKTYIAGAQLLLRRNRTEEASASFGRIDDLITRMNALTAQLKSFARKGGDELAEVDLRTVVTEALAIMAPQTGQRGVEVIKYLPDSPVKVMGDQLRLEQIVINLVRNALDALRQEANPRVEIEVAEGETLARLQVRDNGPGFDGSPDQVFEPFYTTKAAGDGVGLGLAISSQIAADLGGRLTGRTGSNGGAVFELALPQVRSTSDE
ncbi:MAG: ATP-binding protein [Pseudomonadota bacterium]